MRFSEVLDELMDRPEAHARFANTLSLLEYMGARKILKSQRAEGLSMRILGHAAEEIRHAQILKGLALRLSQGRLVDYSDTHTLRGREARAYLQSVDRACASVVSDQDVRRCYALTTLVIEERALKIYPPYEAMLRARSIPNALGSIIKDEDRHLSEIADDLRDDTVLGALPCLRAQEAEAFDRFLAAVVSPEP